MSVVGALRVSVACSRVPVLQHTRAIFLGGFVPEIFLRFGRSEQFLKSGALWTVQSNASSAECKFLMSVEGALKVSAACSCVPVYPCCNIHVRIFLGASCLNFF